MSSSDVTDSSMDEMPDVKRRKNSPRDIADIDSMKVSDLREALKSRGLDVKGNKALLKERLAEALAAETEAAPANASPEVAEEDDDDSDDAADSSFEQRKTPTNGAMSSDEVDSDAPSMPETPGRNIKPISETPQNLLTAASMTLERLNEEDEMVGDPAVASRSVASSKDETDTFGVVPLGADAGAAGNEGKRKEEKEDAAAAERERERREMHLRAEEERMRAEMEEEERLGEERLRVEKERLEREVKDRMEREEQERMERERERLEREERKRLEREERKRLEREERERLEREERERVEREKRERTEREERERLEREERERLEREELESEERERLEKEERVRLEREEKERIQRKERERLEREEKEKIQREERERLEKERMEREEKERAEKEREEMEMAEREEMEKLERARKERDESERAERERVEGEERIRAEEEGQKEVEKMEEEEEDEDEEEEPKGREEIEEKGAEKEESREMETSEGNEAKEKSQVRKKEDKEAEREEPVADSKRVDETKGEAQEEDEEEGDEEEDDEDEEEKENLELKKYWEAVKENPTDFTAWTYLLQFVEQNNEIRPARAAFDAFFKRYPYCYGYWKKYADMERKNDKLKKTEEVFERGVKAIPLSIDLWIHYINFYVDKFDKKPEGHSKIRSLYERAITSAGLEFRSDKLWDHYINWETSKEEFRRVYALFNNLVAIPTQLYSANFEKFKTLLQSHDPKDLLGKEEYEALAKKINEKKKRKERRKREEDEEDDKKEEEEEEKEKVDLEIAVEDKHRAQEKLISMKESTFKTTELEVSKRWAFEEGIKRPYFHVKPLEKSQLKNWKDYLDFEIANGTFERVVVLFERCVIACALYEEYWLKYVAYMKKHSVDAARSLFDRACTIHLQKKPNIHTEWAAFEEMQGNIKEAHNVLSNIQSSFPELLTLSLRLIGLHRRHDDLEKVKQLYEKFLAEASSSLAPKNNAAFFAVKYARFLSKTVKSYEKAREVLKEALKKDKDNVRLQLQLLEVETSNDVVNETRVLKIFDTLIKNERDAERKIQFSKRRLEFLEDHGTKIETIQQMHDEHQSLAASTTSSGRKRSCDDVSDGADSKKAKSNTPVPAGPPPPTGFPASGPPQSGMDPTQAAAAAAAWSQQQQQQQQPPWAGQQWGQGQWGQQGYGYGNYAGYGNYSYPQQ